MDNISLQGSPALTNHILSGFSNSNWGYKDITINLPTYNSWEAGCKFTTGSDISSVGSILGTLRATSQGSSCGFGVYIYNGSLMFAVPLASYNNPNVTLSTPISANTTYTVKVKFTGSAYELYLDGVLKASTSNSSKGLYNSNYNNKLYLGQYRDTADASLPFTGGTIDLNNCYFIADGNILWQGVERSKTYYSPARKTNGFYIPTRKRDVQIVNSSVLNLNGRTMADDFTMSFDGSDARLYTTDTMPLDTADSWEWRTKFIRIDGSSDYGAIIGHDNSNFCSAPYLQVIKRESGFMPYSTAVVVPVSSSTYITVGDYSHVFLANTPYYVKIGFTGTEYYLDVNTSGWDAPFERWGSYSSITKCYIRSNTKTEFMGRITAYSSGTMDFKETRLFINGQVYWEYITNKIVNGFYTPSRKDNT